MAKSFEKNDVLIENSAYVHLLLEVSGLLYLDP